MRVGGVILAAGLGRRFGGRKMVAPLEGEPMLAHVLRAARSASLADVVLVLGADADEVSAALDVTGIRMVVNPEPERGLSGSLRLGLAALDAQVEAALVLLGDQPRVRLDVIRRVLAAAVDPPPERLFVIPRYAEASGPNPALLLRAAWPLAEQLTADRGMGPMIDAHPELALEVPVPGSNPDIDTPEDLGALNPGPGRARPG